MIIPDTRDWTFVLREGCPECGYSPTDVSPADVPARIRSSLPRWRDALARPTAGDRPAASVWSPLEYGCHARDVFRLFDERLDLMLTRDDPTFANWDQDATAIAEDYGSQDPAQVAADLTAAGSSLADRFASLTPDQWSRTGHRDNGSDFTVESFARYFLHDIEHHLHDVAA